MATIKDIARLSGVGATTVSRVLNGGKNVKKETMEKILKVVQELNYKPNPAARYLKRGEYSLSTIGIVLPKVAHPFWFEIIRGIYDMLYRVNYNLLIFSIDSNPEDVYTHIIDERLAGVLIVASPLTDKIKKMFQLINTSYLFVDFYDKYDPSISLDNDMGGRLAASHFIDKGLTRIAYIGYREDFSMVQDETHQIQRDRLTGFKSALAQNNIFLQKEEYVSLENNEAYEITKDILATTEIEGIFYFCDQIAYRGLQAIKESGKNINIIGYDDMQASQYLHLTTIQQPAYRVGYEATNMILKMMKEGKKSVQSLCIKPELIVRET